VKKSEEPPTVQEPPASLLAYFDSLFTSLVASVLSPDIAWILRYAEPIPRAFSLWRSHTRITTGCDADPRGNKLYAVSDRHSDSSQALIVFAIETYRFKNNSLVKVNKFGAVSNPI
jgi:hypothetical protein